MIVLLLFYTDNLMALCAEALTDFSADKSGGAGDNAAAACGIGEKITVNLPDRSISGIFSGIDDKGILLLDRGPDGMMSVAAGDVFFG